MINCAHLFPCKGKPVQSEFGLSNSFLGNRAITIIFGEASYETITHASKFTPRPFDDLGLKHEIISLEHFFFGGAGRNSTDKRQGLQHIKLNLKIRHCR